MKRYLIAIDLDGTLLPDLYGLSDYSVKVFNKIREMGHEIVITTGRPFRSSFFVYYKFGLETPMINYNGQYIHNPRDKEYPVYSDLMSREDILDVYNKEKDNYTHFFAEHYDNIYVNIDDEKIYPLMHYNNLSTLIVGDMNNTLKCGVHGSLILSKEGHGEEIKNYVLNSHKNIGARIWSWGPYKEIVELYSLKSSKGSAIEMVRKELGFKKEDVIACGDSINDYEFFNVAGIRVSLSNADDSIKKISDYVYPVSCGDDGLAKFFIEFLNIKL